ncbi:MAG: M23 family metallopeptidase [Alistipes onderdonkii]
MAGDDFAPLMVGTWKQLDALARILYLESVSFDELQAFARDKEKNVVGDPGHLAHRPLGAAQRPYRRLQPAPDAPDAGVYPAPTKGIDLGCDRGTPVYATATPWWSRLPRGNSGYGHMVLLNHEFGYKTRYAHLSKVLVQPGERVARGQVIAETGNTGISSGPHLHHEVIHKGMPVNPINYFNRNMTAAEYDALMENMRDHELRKALRWQERKTWSGSAGVSAANRTSYALTVHFFVWAGVAVLYYPSGSRFLRHPRGVRAQTLDRPPAPRIRRPHPAGTTR